MPDALHTYGLVLALAALPAAGNFFGGVLAEILPISNRLLSLALHAAAGIVLGVVGIELMPRVLAAERPGLILLFFVLGGAFFMLVDQAIDFAQARFAPRRPSGGPWAIYFGVAVDLFSDGILIGTGSTIALGLGVLLAIAQVPADIPEGFATIATFRRLGFSRRIRLWLAASFALPIFAGASLGYWFLRESPDIAKLSLLAFTAGILVTVVVEEIVPEAHRNGEARLASLVFVSGFALFAALSLYLG